MEEATKVDLKKLEAKLQAVEYQIEAEEEKLDGSTVGQFETILKRIKELQIKREAVSDAISRIVNRNFSKNVPERHITVSITTLNRFAR